MENVNTSYLYTLGAYATLVTVVGAAYYARSKKTAPPAKSTKSAQSEPRKEDRKKKQRMESFTSEKQGSSEKASKSKTYAEAAEAQSTPTTAPASTSKDKDDDAEFAKQLSKAKEGKQFAAGPSNNKKNKAKSVKQSRANIDAPAQEKPSVQSASSTNGAEADDDQSATQSPVAAPADASGVADMLEPAAAAPSVLRLTETEPKDNKKKKATKAPEPVESKKQRQNRKKAEANKAAREEAEKERRVLEEKQRRAARIGEGRAAKDGSQYTNAAAATSAWTQGTPNGNKTEAAASTGSFGLLDTVDDEPAIKEAAQKAPQPKPAHATQPLPTEEEQIEMLKKDDEWSTVKSKASKRSARKEASNSGDDVPAKPSAPAPAPAVSKAQQTTAPSTGNNKSKPKGPQNFGSFSALTTKDEPEEEVEEEWEV